MNTKHQNLSERSGVYLQKEELLPPTLHNIQAIDLHHFDRLESLYWQAVSAGWLDHSESNTLNWICAAVRAREVVRKSGGSAVRVFVAIVRRKLWNMITGAQEEYARKTLVRFRETQPQCYQYQSLYD